MTTVKWKYQDKEVCSHSDLPENTANIVYAIRYKDGRSYIGKKTIRSETITPAKKSLEARDGATRIFKNIIRDGFGQICTSKKSKATARRNGHKAKREPYDSAWKNQPFIKYVGSSKLTKGLQIVDRTILYCCKDKISATYLETASLFEHNVLFNDDMLNDCIGGNFWSNVLDGVIDDNSK